MWVYEVMDTEAQEQWAAQYRDWYEYGKYLSAREESGMPPKPDEYAFSNDEAARLVEQAACLLLRTRRVETDNESVSGWLS